MLTGLLEAGGELFCDDGAFPDYGRPRESLRHRLGK